MELIALIVLAAIIFVAIGGLSIGGRIPPRGVDDRLTVAKIQARLDSEQDYPAAHFASMGSR
ncbi:hypothetical protein [Nocardia acidivorans]|uniref:hypothetical protein n=1 Tax=Nocardia acidivorans TaxID=404580 RepID=UPI000A80F10C|nr:hypothetical protein [Nocardia acidivorans]